MKSGVEQDIDEATRLDSRLDEPRPGFARCVAPATVIHTPDDNFLDDLQLPDNKAQWEDALNMAKCYDYGLGDFLQDDVEALKYYQLAAMQGSGEAYLRLGQMHRIGRGVRESKAKALEFYKAGAKLGYVNCYAEMGALFTLERHFDNMRKCFQKYFESDTFLRPVEENDIFYSTFYAIVYFRGLVAINQPFDPLLVGLLYPKRQQIMDAVQEQLSKTHDLDQITGLESTIKLIRASL